MGWSMGYQSMSISRKQVKCCYSALVAAAMTETGMKACMLLQEVMRYAAERDRNVFTPGPPNCGCATARAAQSATAATAICVAFIAGKPASIETHMSNMFDSNVAHKLCASLAGFGS